MAGNGQTSRVWKGEFILKTSVCGRAYFVRFQFFPPFNRIKLSTNLFKSTRKLFFNRIWKNTIIYLTCLVNVDSFCQIFYRFVTSRRSCTRENTNFTSSNHLHLHTNLLFFTRITIPMKNKRIFAGI